MKDVLERISTIKGCLLEINELNFGLLLPLLLTHAASACYLPFAIAQANNEQMFYYSLLLVSIAFLVVTSICGRFVCRHVAEESLFWWLCILFTNCFHTADHQGEPVVGQSLRRDLFEFGCILTGSPTVSIHSFFNDKLK